MNNLKNVCVAICLLSIILGVILSMAMIWGNVESETAYKAWATLIVFFFASLGGGILAKIGEKKE